MTCHGHQSYTVDHSLLSPSGRMSKRAQAAAMKQERKRMAEAERRDEAARAACPECSAALARARVAQRANSIALLESQAAGLRRLADGGLRPKAHRELAAKLEAQAAALRAEPAAGQTIESTGRAVPGNSDGRARA
jgi:hypothetical protein